MKKKLVLLFLGMLVASGSLVSSYAQTQEKDYPEVKRKFGKVGQQNRYLREVTATSGGEEQTIFTAATQEELPFTYYAVAGSVTADGALIDKTNVPIIIEEGETSFDMKFKAWTESVVHNGSPISTELIWTYQAYYIDWNKDYEFSGTNEISPSIGSANGSNDFGDPKGSLQEGWNRAISIPANVEPGEYRMRVVYAEFSDEANWPGALFTKENGVLINGVAYDFTLVVTKAGPVLNVVSPTKGGSIKVTDTNGKEIANGTLLEVGTTITVEAIPEEYYFATGIKVNRSEQTLSNNKCTVAVTGKMTISATFDAYTCTIPAEEESGRAIVMRNGVELTNGALIKKGEKLMLSMLADDKHAPSSLKVNGELVEFFGVKEQEVIVENNVVISDLLFIPAGQLEFESIGEGEVIITRNGEKLDNKSKIFEGEVFSIEAVADNGYQVTGIYLNDDYEYNWLTEAPEALKAYKLTETNALYVIAEFAQASGINSTNMKSFIHSTSIHQELVIYGKEGCNVMITNVTGAMVYTGVIANSEQSIPASSWPAGLYLVKVDNITVKVVKY